MHVVRGRISYILIHGLEASHQHIGNLLADTTKRAVDLHTEVKTEINTNIN